MTWEGERIIQQGKNGEATYTKDLKYKFIEINYLIICITVNSNIMVQNGYKGTEVNNL